MVRVRTLIVSVSALLAVAACKADRGSKSPKGQVSSGIKQIAVSDEFTVALFNDGHVRMVGTPLRNGSPDLREVGFGGKVAKISAGKGHVCALLESGSVRCMGRNAWGALGYGHTDPVADPAAAGDVDVGGKVVDVSAGQGYTCALLEAGKVRCWGTAQGGRLGYGNHDDVLTPATAGDVPIGGATRAIQVGPFGTTCAVLEAGSLRCWGQSLQGGLGYGSMQDVGADNTPESVGDVQLPGKVVSVAIGIAHVCALMEGGKVRCWGFGDKGRLGYPAKGNVGDDETPIEAPDVDVGGSVSAVEAGGNQTCARLEAGSVRCWGIGREGQLGYGDTPTVGDKQTPAQAGDLELGGKVKQLAASPTQTCALLESGDVMCWGHVGGGKKAAKKPTRLEFG